MTRGITCWCSKCVVGDFNDCLEKSEWSVVDLKEVEKRKKGGRADDKDEDDESFEANPEDVEALIIRIPVAVPKSIQL